MLVVGQVPSQVSGDDGGGPGPEAGDGGSCPGRHQAVAHKLEYFTQFCPRHKLEREFILQI